MTFLRAPKGPLEELCFRVLERSVKKDRRFSRGTYIKLKESIRFRVVGS